MTEELRAIDPLQAWDILNADPRAVLVDIRSSMEYLFVGHPKGAVHVPWIDEPDWDINPDFIVEVRKVMLGGVVSNPGQSSAPVILICRSGKRSKQAGEALLEAGFHSVYHIHEGFEGDLDENRHRSTLGGWRFHNLPWEQC